MLRNAEYSFKQASFSVQMPFQKLPEVEHHISALPSQLTPFCRDSGHQALVMVPMASLQTAPGTALRAPPQSQLHQKHQKHLFCQKKGNQRAKSMFNPFWFWTVLSLHIQSHLTEISFSCNFPGCNGSKCPQSWERKQIWNVMVALVAHCHWHAVIRS